MRGLATQGYQMPDAPAARYRGALWALADYVKIAIAGKSFPQLSPARHAASSAGERGQCLTILVRHRDRSARVGTLISG